FLPVFIFLTSFCSNINIPGPYNNIDKCLIILFFLIKGHSINDMCIYFDTDTSSSFYNIYKYKYNNIGMSIGIRNFCYPVRKLPKTDLTSDQIYFNENLGSFRSRIESYFADISQTFKRLNGQNNVRVTKTNTYNIQLKLCCLLNNIKVFYRINSNNIKLNNNYFKLWMDNNFDFFNPKNPNIILKNVTEKTQFKLEQIDDIK
ncbi:hypothetical protein BY458DRAFT_422413, partial [Sporodiniella umbellata]